MRRISATDLARHTREILDQVASDGDTVVIERNHIMIAQLVPPQRTRTASQALAGRGLPMLTARQAAAWLKDSKDDEAVRDPWASTPATSRVCRVCGS